MADEPLDPVLHVVMIRLARDFRENGIEVGVAGRGPVHEVQRLQVGIYAPDERKFREHGADHGAIQLPAVNLVKVAGLLVQKHQEQLFGQRERLHRQPPGWSIHRPWPPCVRLRAAPGAPG